MVSGEELNEYVGREIHMRMWRRGISQRALAEALGIGQSTMSKKLRGSVTWSVEELVSSAAFLNVPVPDLLPPDVTHRYGSEPKSQHDYELAS